MSTWLSMTGIYAEYSPIIEMGGVRPPCHGRPAKGAGRKATLLGVVAVVLLALAERALERHYYSHTYRYYEAGEVYWEDSHTLLLFSPDRYLFWRPKPRITIQLAETPKRWSLHSIGARSVPYSFTIRTNGAGWNSPEFQCEKPADVLRIVSLGDSRTMAEGVAWAEVYPRRLEALLRARGDWRRVEVLNAAVSGYSSYQGLVALERELLACRPDVVTVLFGINDQDSEQGVSDREKAALFDSPLTTLRAWLNRSMLLYSLRRAAGQLRGAVFGRTAAGPVPLGPPERSVPRVSLEEYRRNLSRMLELGLAAGARMALLILPTSPYSFDRSLSADVGAQLPAGAAHELGDARSRMQRDPADSAQRLERIVAASPAFSEAHYRLAECYQRLRRFEEAHREFLEAGRASVFSRYAAVVREVARRPGVVLVDLTPEFTALRAEPLYVDDMHPNALGHEIVAGKLAEALASSEAVQ